MLVSDSTHMPPTGTNRPSAARLRMRANSSGWWSRIQAYCWADEAAKTSSSSVSMSCSALANVRVTLRTVSRTGHSHAESMCACPTAYTRWALA